jgi:FMN phosphatase YigB (HAD superfamily)
MDRGRPMAQAIAARQRLHPAHAELIARWREGWPEMLRGEIAGTVAVLDELASRGRRLYALTNFSHETWPVARARFGFLGRFEDVVVSGEVGMVKPDPRIYRLAIERCRLSDGPFCRRPASERRGRPGGADAVLTTRSGCATSWWRSASCRNLPLARSQLEEIAT